MWGCDDVDPRGNARARAPNANMIAERVLEKVNALRGYMLPQDLNVTVTRNYGENRQGQI